MFVKNQFKVIGRDIRLADVLIAMRGNKKAPIGIDINGYFINCDNDCSNVKSLKEKWNLKNNSLAWHYKHQTETCEYLFNLLV